MKKLVYLSIFSLIAILLSCCVTKQKYQELESKYKKCEDDLTYTTAEKIDFENAKKELEQEVGLLKSRIEKLKNDTLDLSKRLSQSERDFAKAKKDYDDLLKDFAEHNLANNAEMNKVLTDLEKVKSQLDAKEAELNRKSDELDQLSTSLAEKEARLAELQNILDQKDAEVRALKDKVMNALKGFEGSGLNVYEKNGKVYVSMEDKLLFASASWEVGAKGEAALKEVAKILEAEPDISVLIEGHTDNVPYKGSGQVKDNWDLSVMRATSIVKSLLKFGKIDPKRLSASGRGEYFPIDAANTAEARAKNRRTEIILTPKLDELFKVLDSNN